jgi:hypothetical protein
LLITKLIPPVIGAVSRLRSTPSTNRHRIWEMTLLKAPLWIRVDFKEGTILSPGKVRLFELVDECGSLEQAAATIQMDYEHARHVVERLELTAWRQGRAADARFAQCANKLARSRFVAPHTLGICQTGN